MNLKLCTMVKTLVLEAFTTWSHSDNVYHVLFGKLCDIVTALVTS